MSARSPWPRRARLALLALMPLLLMAWSWGQWPDAQVDFGRELYGAWRISAGDRLYSELAWFNGPLSVHWNAMWMGLFGVSLRTQALVNLALVYVTLALLMSLVRRWSSPVAATGAGFVFLGAFAFGQYLGVGNYNFIAPYSHEIVHGLILGLAALAALSRLGRGGDVRWAALAGGLLGLAFLTKAEVFLAAAGATVLRMGLHLAEPRVAGERGRVAAAFGVAALVPPAIAWALLARYLPAGAALRATLGSWAYVGEGAVRELSFYRSMSGFDRPWQHLASMMIWGGGVVGVLTGVVVLGRRLPASANGNVLARVGALVFGLLGGGLVLWLIEWRQLARPLPVYVAVAALFLVPRWWRSRAQPKRAAPAADQLAFAALAGLLLLKMLLNVMLEHYGFALALPATAMLVAVLVDALPRRVGRDGGPGRLVRAATVGALLAFVGVRLYSSNGWFERKHHRVQGHGDVVRADWRGPALIKALEDLEQRLGPDDTLFVLPEGVMLNFLLRRRNPTPFVNFMPPELIFWGEQPVISALHAHPPDAIALVHKDTLDDYGVPWFGSPSFGEGIMTWVHANYRVAETYGAEPLRRAWDFGVQIWVPKER